MAWTAKLLRLKREHGRIEVALSFTDGIEVVDKTYQFDRTTKKDIKRLARNEVKRLEANKSEVFGLSDGADIDLTEPVVVPTPPPTGAELAKRAWFKDWNKLQTLLLLVSSNIIQSNDSRIAPLQTSLRDNLLTSYLKGI